MNAVPTSVEAVSRVEVTDVPQHVVAAFQEAMIRDGREAAMYVIAGRGHTFKDVAEAAMRTYGPADGM